MMRFLARLLAAVLFLTLAVDASAAEAATRPSAPRAVKATPGNLAVKVSWVVPASNGGAAIDRYAVQRWNPTTRKWVTVKITTASTRSWTNTGLTNGTKYFFVVLAHNRLGWGRPSAQVSATPRTVPLSPRFLEADVYDRALGTFWVAPSSNGGAPVDSYRVEISTDGATWTNPKDVPTVGVKTTAPVMFSLLTAGNRYWVRVRAHNAAGFGVGTSSGPYRAIAPPGPVTSLDAVVGDGQVELSWVAPPSPTSAPAIAQYKVERSTDGTTWTEIAVTTDDSYLATGLTNGTTYQFRVSARSAIERVGYGTTATITPSAPGSPGVPLSLTLEGSDSDTTLDWSAPTSNGASALTKYEVESWTDPTARSVQEVDPGTTEASVDELALTHTFRVRACNAISCGAWSAEIGPIPGVVQDLAAESTGSTVALDWDAPANVAVAVTDYTVSRGTTADGPWTELDTTAGTAFVYETASPETTYWYRVVANGADGSGSWEPIEVTTGPAHLLSASPTSITVNENGNNTFQVTLDPVVTEDTVIQVATSDSSAAVPTSSTVTIPSGQFSATVTINGINDLNLSAEAVTITLTYGTQTKQVSVTVIDDDVQTIVADPTATVTAGDSTQVGVALQFQPTGNVTVNVGSSDTDTATVTPSFLTFTPSNWNTPQSVTINGVAAGGATVSLTSTDVTTKTIDVTVEEPTP